MRRTTLLAAALLMAVGACTEEVQTPFEPQLSRSPADRGSDHEAKYRVTIWNLSTGQPFTPPLAAVHNGGVRLWRVGRRASNGIREIAENGNLAPMVERLEASKKVHSVSVNEGPTLPPLLPGEEMSFEVGATHRAKYLSIVSMLICTNDGFTGVTRRRLPRWIGDKITMYRAGYDAGTERNTEDFADMVPPCPPLTGFETDDMGTGMSNPALATKQRIRRHRGIRGHNDLDREVHGWRGPVMKIQVERIG